MKNMLVSKQLLQDVTKLIEEAKGYVGQRVNASLVLYYIGKLGNSLIASYLMNKKLAMVSN
jgi:hypothetical protein